MKGVWSSISRCRITPLGVFSAVVILTALALRAVALGTVPGISGDEAAVWARLHDFAHGKQVSWWSPTGKLISPLYLATLVPFKMVFPTEFTTLRYPGLVAGLALVVLTYRTLRGLFSARAARLTALVVLSLPMHFIYSRLYIEQSLMGLTFLPILYYCTTGRAGKGIAWSAVAVAVHPVNIFLTPLALSMYFHHVGVERAIGGPALRRRIALALGAAAGGAIAIVLYVPREAFTGTLGNLIALNELPGYLILVARIFTGVTPITDIAGPIDPTVVFVAQGAFWILLWLGLALGVPALRERGDTRALAFVGGWAVTVLGFYAVAGTIGVTPGMQRHALFLMVPTALTLVLLWEAALGERSRARTRTLEWGTALVCAGMIAFYSHTFFGRYLKTGGESHVIYQTASVEPKEAVHRWLVEDGASAERPVIAEDWWVYQPVRYLAQGQGDYPVLMMYRHDSAMRKEDAVALLEHGGYLVGWENGKLHEMVRSRYARDELVEAVFTNARRDPVLRVWRRPRG